ncbi:MAG TPA: glycosyltransferase family 2 protein [Mycobacteriales bacterium]|nr:glycosyltransferase family 2 protein [Mycobacteriales bacterium]
MTAASAARQGARVPVRVVVVTYSPGESLTTFLDSLSTATSWPVEVVLADNGSTDEAPERAAAARADVRLLRLASNAGYGAAANAGASGASGDWLVVVNPDVEWAPGSLDLLLEAGARWPRAGAVGPAILTPEGDLYPSARAFPSLGRGIGHALLGWWWPTNPWTRDYRRERGVPTEGPTGWLSGSCMLLRREAFEAVGGFDPAYFMYFEDLDLCRRLDAAGWERVHVPAAVVRHTGGHATSREPLRMQVAHHRSAYRYLAQEYPGPRWAPLRALLAAGLLGRLLLAVAVRRVRHGATPTRSGTILAEPKRGS